MKRSGPLRRRTPLRPGVPPQRVTPMPRSSLTSKRGPTRRVEVDRVYIEARAAVFQRAHGRCEFAIDGVCTGRAVHAHHRRRRRYDPQHATLAAVCDACHRHVHDRMGTEAFRLGFLLHNLDASGHDPWTPPTQGEPK